MPIRTAMLSLLILAQVPAAAAGIRVRFLPSPPEDSVVRYEVWRRDSAAAEAKVGSLTAGLSADTLTFPDSTARKGVAYLYRLRAVDASGTESDFSDSALVALPRLLLPDSARPSAGGTLLPLGPSAHPLAGHAPLAFSLADSSRLRLVHDTASRTLRFLSPLGLADTVTAVVRAAYHGKFADLDTLVVVVAGESPTALGRARGADPAAAPARPAGKGPWPLAVPWRGRARLLRPDGRLIP